MMHCETESLRRYLLGESTPEQIAMIEEHLTDCVACQNQIRDGAAPDDFWVDTAEALGQPAELLGLDDESVDRLVSGKQPFGRESEVPQSQRITVDGSTSDTQRQPITSAMLLKHLRDWCDPPLTAESIGKIDNYLIVEIVGHGGMGVVLRAIDMQLGRTVAIKTLLQPSAIDTGSCDRLLREAQAVASLKHEHVIDMHSIGHWRNVPFIVMPFVQGGTLGDHARDHSFSPEQIIDVARQIAEALAAAHRSGLVHRDIKPSNVLLENGLEHVVLADFGLARVGGDFTVTQTGMAPGTPQWMSPEQAVAATVDHRSDQFSLGSMMYWMATGKCPFDSDSCYAILMKLVNEEATPIAELSSSTPEYLTVLIRRMMMKTPEDRFGDMGQVAALLKSCLVHLRDGHSPLPEELRSPHSSRIHRLARLPSVRLAIIGSAIVALAVASIVYYAGANVDASNADAPNADASPAAVIAQAIEPVTDASVPTDVEDQEVATPDRGSFQVERYGPLDEIELSNAIDDFNLDSNIRYWLRRLAYLPADQIPPKLIPKVMALSDDEDVTTAELALVILEKNPFVEVPQSMPLDESSPAEENPFVVIDQE